MFGPKNDKKKQRDVTDNPGRRLKQDIDRMFGDVPDEDSPRPQPEESDDGE